MNESEKEILDTMLGYLGFIVEIEEQQQGDQKVLQIFTQDHEILVGTNQEIMGDLQFLLNRILQARDMDAPRVLVDVEHHRLMRDDEFVHKIQQLADLVRRGGPPAHTEPLNSYDRRLVHNAFLNDPEISTSSPKEPARYKSITIRKKVAQ